VLADDSHSSSDSEFIAPNMSSSSDDDTSSDGFVRPVSKRRNARARSGAVQVVDEYNILSDDLDDEDRPLTSARARTNGGAPAKGKVTKRKSRAKGKVPPEPVPKLSWELSDDEWEGVWGEATDADFDNIKTAKLPSEQRDPPKELLMPLLPFQKEWLAWSMKQEASKYKGGVLADEMGMGKTIQAISLIVAGRALTQSAPKFDLNAPLAASTSSCADTCGDVKKSLPKVKGTLVICPLVAVIQWRNEISRFTLNGSVKVLIYHGPRRSIGLADLEQYDIILTTYSIVELEHRKHVMPPKDVCQ
jgi:DNA repair protein RAD16